MDANLVKLLAVVLRGIPGRWACPGCSCRNAARAHQGCMSSLRAAAVEGNGVRHVELEWVKTFREYKTINLFSSFCLFFFFLTWLGFFGVLGFFLSSCCHFGFWVLFPLLYEV